MDGQQDHIQVLENTMLKAQRMQDPITYVTACAELGINPADSILYELGLSKLTESKQEKGLEKIVKKSVKTKNIGSFFLSEAAGLPLNDFYKSAEDKKEVLQKCFPKRFGANGKQSLNGYEAEAIGAIFYKLYTFYSSKES